MFGVGCCLCWCLLCWASWADVVYIIRAPEARLSARPSALMGSIPFVPFLVLFLSPILGVHNCSMCSLMQGWGGVLARSLRRRRRVHESFVHRGEGRGSEGGRRRALHDPIVLTIVGIGEVYNLARCSHVLSGIWSFSSHLVSPVRRLRLRSTRWKASGFGRVLHLGFV